MFQDHLLIAKSLMTNELCWGTPPSNLGLPLLLDLCRKNKHAVVQLVLLLKNMHSQGILEVLVYTRYSTTLPPTNKLYINLPTEKFMVEQ